jgi:glucose-6-phosphate 1-dehydrogenase
VIFGAAGDLTKRLLFPSLYNLAQDGLLPEEFAVIGFARSGFSADEFREHLRRSVREAQGDSLVSEATGELLRRDGYERMPLTQSENAA